MPNQPITNDPLKPPKQPQQPDKLAASSHQRLKMLFDAVCELSPDQQQARLSEMQASELEIERVQKLLQIDITPGDISTLPNVIELMATSVPTAMLTNVVTPSCLLNFA